MIQRSYLASSIPMAYHRLQAVTGLFALCAFISSQAQTPLIVQYQACLGGAGGDFGSAIMPTLDGGSIVVGYTGSTDGQVTGFQGGQDFWVVKLDHLGELQWQTSAGGTGIERASDISMATDGGYVIVGSTYSSDGDVSGAHGGADLWVLKLHANGAIHWSRSLGGSADDAAVSVTASANGFLVAGYTASADGDVTGNHGSNDLWLLELDQAGALLWQRCIGGTGDDRAGGVSLTDDGGCIIAGQTTSTDGDVAGNLGGKDFWLVKCAADGALQWQRCLGGTADDWGICIATTSDGGYVAGGATLSSDGDVSGAHGATDAWVVKTDSDGAIEWQHCMGGSGVEIVGSVVRTGDERTIVLGYTNSTDGDVVGNHGSYDAWLVKLDADGGYFWRTCLGGTGDDRGIRAQATEDRALVCTGWTYSTNGDVSGNHGGGDMWAVRCTDAFNRVRGTVYGDLNNDGLLDAADVPAAYQLVQNAAGDRLTFSEMQGSYELTVLDTGTHIVQAMPAPYFTPSPPSRSCYFADNQLISTGNDFGLQSIADVNELRVTLTPISAFRPGFEARYELRYFNDGTTTLNPTLSFLAEYQGTFLDASVPPEFASTDSAAWVLPPLAPFGSGLITVRILVDQTAQVGSHVSSTAFIRPVSGDALPHNNDDTWRNLVTASLDPNDVLVDREVITPEELIEDRPLTYIIRFQNTGNDTAFNVLLRNPLPVNVRPQTIAFEASSHPMVMDYSNEANILWFRFDDILLPDSSTNESMSHGYVRYRITPNGSLLVGDSVLNQAAIFFDLNAPVITNTAYSVVELTTSVDQETVPDEVAIFPDPATDAVRIALSDANGRIMLSVHDASGRLCDSMTFTGAQADLDVSGWPRGLYLLRISSAERILTRRLVLQ